MTNYWPLAGILIVVLGFALRFNPLLVVVVAAIATGLLGGLDFVAVVEALGKAFNDNRYISVTWIILPVIGLLERYGLQQRARALIESMHGATMGKLLVVYLGFRQITAAIGMKDIGGHPQAVRPLVAPMAEAAAEKSPGRLRVGLFGRSTCRACRPREPLLERFYAVQFVRPLVVFFILPQHFGLIEFFQFVQRLGVQ